MAPRKRVHKSDSSRAMASQAKMKAAGMKRIAVWLNPVTVEKLDRLAKARGGHRAGVIEALVQSAGD